MIRNLAFAGAALAALLTGALPALAGTGACTSFIEPAAASYTAGSGDNGAMISAGNATGAAAGWAAASLPIALPSAAAVGAGYVLCPISENNKAAIAVAPLLAAPAAPGVSASNGGSLGARTEYYKTTFVNQAGETVGSAETAQAIGANQLATVAAPAAPGGSNATGYNVYGASSSGAEQKQNASPVALGTAWTEPMGGLVSGAVPPATGTAPSAYILSGGQTLATLLVGPGNYAMAVLVSDGGNYRVESAAPAATLAISGAASQFPARYVYPGGPGYSATQGDNGNNISSAMAGGTLAVTLPATTAIAAGWSVGLVPTPSHAISLAVNGTAGGSILLPTGSTVSSLTLPGTEFVLLQFDGAEFHFIDSGLNNQPATFSAPFTVRDANGQIILTLVSNGSGTGGVYEQCWPGTETGPQDFECDAMNAGGVHGAGIAFRAYAVSASDPPRVVAIHADLQGYQPGSIWLYQKGDEANAVGLSGPLSGMAGAYVIRLPPTINTNVIGDVPYAAASDGGSYVATAWGPIDGQNIRIQMANGYGISDANGIALLTFVTSASAQNSLTLKNAAHGTPPLLTAASLDGENIAAAISGAGTAGVQLRTGAGTTVLADFEPGGSTIGGDTIATLTASQTLTGKAISGSTNTLSNIANAALVNDSLTVNGTSCVLGAACAPPDPSAVVTTTYNLATASGNQVISGFGFTPTACDVFASVSGQSGSYVTYGGHSDSALTQSDLYGQNGNASLNNAFLTLSDSTGTNYQSGTLSAYGSGSITIAWTKTGSPTGTLNESVRCFR